VESPADTEEAEGRGEEVVDVDPTAFPTHGETAEAHRCIFSAARSLPEDRQGTSAVLRRRERSGEEDGDGAAGRRERTSRARRAQASLRHTDRNDARNR
jgi:hypothetical protein